MIIPANLKLEIRKYIYYRKLSIIIMERDIAEYYTKRTKEKMEEINNCLEENGFNFTIGQVYYCWKNSSNYLSPFSEIYTFDECAESLIKYINFHVR